MLFHTSKNKDDSTDYIYIILLSVALIIINRGSTLCARG